MKKIHLIRHAKSSWSDISLRDQDRPLNTRGIKSCGIMAQQIINAGCNFQHTYCSTAVRAQNTIELIAQHLPAQDVQWISDKTLYTFNGQDLLEWCWALDDAITEVVIVGHNPGMTEFSNTMSDQYIENIPTCAYVQLEYNNPSWSQLAENSTRLLHFLTPKMFKAH